jgi:hypothetical protein
MNMIKQVCILWFVCFTSIFATASKTTIKVANPLNESRSNETIAVDFKLCYPCADANDLKQIKPAVYSETLKTFILCQAVDHDGDGLNDELLFQADFAAGQSQRFTISQADQTPAIKPQNVSIAMYVPQRKDDFAWENDRIAFRVYGQELQRTELTSSGIDVWVKSVTYPVMEKLYVKGHDYYHSDNGEGLDFYNVGTSLGCGGLGVWCGDRLYMAENYADWKIIANGPIRSIFELTYKPWNAGDKKISESRRISLDLGSNFNCITSRFSADINDAAFAVGIVKNPSGGHETYSSEKNVLCYWHNPDPNFGSIGCAVIIPSATLKQSQSTVNHNLIIMTPADKRTFSYYAGAGWSRTPEFSDEQKWVAFVQKKARCIASPLTIEFISE